jgi:Ni2+-binding GTPase involved in maturation of urease and hydrogenase
LLYKMITSKYTNSVLLTGTPASSKTVFILELLDHFKDKAYFAVPRLTLQLSLLW